MGEISNDPLSCLIQSEDPASSLEQREDASEENNDPLPSFFPSEDLAGFLNQKEEEVLGQKRKENLYQQSTFLRLDSATNPI